jgi:transcriptional regulator with XRE-family HTH domain
MLLTPFILKEARRAAGLTQAQLARRVGTSQPEIARLESPRANPRIATLRRAIEATGHTLEATLRPASSDVDRTMLAANLRLSPAERLARFAESYRSIASLAANERAAHGS